MILLSGALTPPLAARAQQQALPVVGILSSVAPVQGAYPPFAAGLAETGFVEGRNFTIDRRSADGYYERLPVLAAELVERRVAVIYAPAFASQAAKAATTEIPIVFATGDDPVATGLVASLSRPGGNITGVSFIAGPLPAKRLEFIHEMVPTAKTIAMLVNPNNANAASDAPEVERAARSLGRRIVVMPAASDAAVEAMFDKIGEAGASALLVNPDSFLTSRRARIVELAAAHKVPAIYAFRNYVDEGGLMSYGGRFAEVFRLAGIYVGRILAGAKPADLPVVQATKTELVVNMKAAKALGLTVPQSILARADEIIE